jgi:hypothetical protein
MSAIPVIRGGLQSLYPVTATYHFDTLVAKSEDGSENRSARLPGALVKFALSWGELAKTDKDTLQSLVSTAKGRFDATASITFLGTTFTNLQLTSDTFEAVESSQIQYDTKLTFVQRIAQDLSPGTMGQPFPTFNGCISQIPWTERKRFRTDVNTEWGPVFPWAWYGSGLSNFPSDGLKGWRVGGDAISDTDIAALVAHFIANFGQYGDFSYTDENATAYTKTHYASDDLVITYQEPNRASCFVDLEVTF